MINVFFLLLDFPPFNSLASSILFSFWFLIYLSAISQENWIWFCNFSIQHWAESLRIIIFIPLHFHIWTIFTCLKKITLIYPIVLTCSKIALIVIYLKSDYQPYYLSTKIDIFQRKKLHTLFNFMNFLKSIRSS